MKNHPAYIPFDLFSRFLAALPRRGIYLFADILFFIGYYLAGYRKKVVFENLTRAFPEKNKAEIRTIARDFYKHLADVMIEDIAMLHMKPSRLKDFVTVDNLDLLDELYKKGKNITALIGHYGNWELLTTISLYTPYTILSVYKPLKNKFFNQRIYQMRKRFDEIPVPMKQVYQYVISHQQEGNPFVIGLVADQSPPRKHINYWTHFLNQETAFFTGAEKIARRFNHAVIFTAVKKIRRGSYQITFQKLVENAGQVEERTITDQYVKALESLIREEPRYWLWSHRRWKHQKP
jgi:KDO2-lipid IV(A) lauroyltransferase